MSASSRGGYAFAALTRGKSRVCSQCLRGAQRPAQRAMYFATAAPVETGTTSPPDDVVAAAATSTSSSDAGLQYHQLLPQHPPQQYHIRSGIILSRPPLLTRPPTSFESAFYQYQKRLNERLTAPFRKQFFFKSDTAADLDWRLKVRERGGRVARELGSYRAGTRDSWNDEVMVLGQQQGQQQQQAGGAGGGAVVSSPDALVDAILGDAEMRISEDGERINDEDRVPVERPLPRRTEADEKADVRRLDRELDRTLYLVVRGKDGRWTFPTSDVRTDENLHETAQRALEQSAGVNMNTWMVGRVPVAHMVTKPLFKDDGGNSGGDTAEEQVSSKLVESKGEKVFFMKARIMAGQADLSNNSLGVTDFRWLTREELEKELSPEYFHSVRNMMAER